MINLRWTFDTILIIICLSCIVSVISTTWPSLTVSSSSVLSLKPELIFSIISIGNSISFDRERNLLFLHVKLFLRNNPDSQIGHFRISSGLHFSVSSARGLTANKHCFQKGFVNLWPIWVHLSKLTLVNKLSNDRSGSISDKLSFSICAHYDSWFFSSLFHQDILNACQDVVKSGELNTPFLSGNFASFLATLSCPPQINQYILSSIVFICFLVRLGRTKARWEI